LPPVGSPRDHRASVECSSWITVACRIAEQLADVAQVSSLPWPVDEYSLDDYCSHIAPVVAPVAQGIGEGMKRLLWLAHLGGSTA